jgi:hypothetical protein
MSTASEAVVAATLITFALTFVTGYVLDRWGRH